MLVAVKVWRPNEEPEPDGLFNRESAPSAPLTWFAEDPEYAAELYALEVTRGPTSVDVAVIDNAGQRHNFTVSLRTERVAKVQPRSR